MGMAMDNIFISTIYLLLTFALTILCFKKYGKYGLYIWMCVLVIISNIQTIKIAEDAGVFKEDDERWHQEIKELFAIVVNERGGILY